MLYYFQAQDLTQKAIPRGYSKKLSKKFTTSPLAKPLKGRKVVVAWVARDYIDFRCSFELKVQVKLGADSGLDELEARRTGDSLFENEVVFCDFALF